MCCWAITVLFGTVLNNSKNNERESIKESPDSVAFLDLARLFIREHGSVPLSPKSCGVFFNLLFLFKDHLYFAC